MSIGDFRALVRKTYPHVKITIRYDRFQSDGERSLRIAGERSAGERNTINQWAAAAGLTPEARTYVYSGARRV